MKMQLAPIVAAVAIFACGASDKGVEQGGGGSGGAPGGGTSGTGATPSSGGIGAGPSDGGTAGDGGATGGTSAVGGTAGTSSGGGTGAMGGAVTGGGGAPSGGGGAGGACVPPVSGPCDTHPLCGCGPTENCVYDVAACPGASCGSTKCILAGSAASYGACTTTAECPKEHACIGGVCKKYCASSPGCGAAYRACVEIFASAVKLPDGFVCTQLCDPRNPLNASGGFSPCPPNVQCMARPQFGSGVTDCAGKAGAGGSGAACTTDNDCQGGFACGTDYKCHKSCTVGGTDCPTQYPTCQPTSVFAQTIQLGLCV